MSRRSNAPLKFPKKKIAPIDSAKQQYSEMKSPKTHVHYANSR